MYISNGYCDPRSERFLATRTRNEAVRLWISKNIREGVLRNLHEYDSIMGDVLPRLIWILRLGKFTVDNGHQFDPTLHLTPRDIEVDSREDPSMASERFKHRGEAWTYLLAKWATNSTGWRQFCIPGSKEPR